VLIGCASCDGNKGHPLQDVYRLLAGPFKDYERTRKPQTTTLPPEVDSRRSWPWYEPARTR
jgi:hypothetical protein